MINCLSNRLEINRIGKQELFELASINLIAALNTLRVVALSTNDQLIRTLCLDSLNETEVEIKEKLSKTCYGGTIDKIRVELQNQYGIKD